MPAVIGLRAGPRSAGEVCQATYRDPYVNSRGALVNMRTTDIGARTSCCGEGAAIAILVGTTVPLEFDGQAGLAKAVVAHRLPHRPFVFRFG